MLLLCNIVFFLHAWFVYFHPTVCHISFTWVETTNWSMQVVWSLLHQSFWGNLAGNQNQRSTKLHPRKIKHGNEHFPLFNSYIWLLVYTHSLSREHPVVVESLVRWWFIFWWLIVLCSLSILFPVLHPNILNEKWCICNTYLPIILYHWPFCCTSSDEVLQRASPPKQPARHLAHVLFFFFRSSTGQHGYDPCGKGTLTTKPIQIGTWLMYTKKFN